MSMRHDDEREVRARIQLQLRYGVIDRADVARVNPAVDEDVQRAVRRRQAKEEEISKADAVHAHARPGESLCGGRGRHGRSVLAYFGYCFLVLRHRYTPAWMRPKSI